MKSILAKGGRLKKRGLPLLLGNCIGVILAVLMLVDRRCVVREEMVAHEESLIYCSA